MLITAQGEDGSGAVQAPPRSADVEPVADQVAACSFDDPSRDRPACCQCPVVGEVVLFGGQVVHARVRAVALAAGQAGCADLGGDVLRDAGAVAGQYRECLDRDPVLGGGIAGRVQAPCGLPQIFKYVDESITIWMVTPTPGLGPQHNWHFLTDLSPKCRLRHFSEKAVGVVPRSKLLRVTVLRSAADPADRDRGVPP